MIDLNDKIYVTMKSGRRILRYKCTCGNCSIDRGYQDKNQGYRLCRLCANTEIAKTVHLGKTLSDETKAKMSKAATKRYNDSNWKPKHEIIKAPKIRVYKNLVTPIQKKIKHNTRTLLYGKLKRRNISKRRSKTFDLLGYSAEDLIKHLESKFQGSMNWENYGKWHIDHIKPDSWFKYSSVQDQSFKDSWALSNLQPLWAKDNLSKNNKFEG